VFVDDGSTDESRRLLQEAAGRDHRIRVVVLSRNFGHQAALGAALDHATGDAVVLMDADLQINQKSSLSSFGNTRRAPTSSRAPRVAGRRMGY
jgi:dolichol-phosphate mannosyltransferase